MKKIFAIIFCLLTVFVESKSQQIAAYEDDRKHLYVFDKKSIQEIEYLPVSKYYVGKNYLAYLNSLNEFIVYFNGEKQKIKVDNPGTVIAQDYLLGILSEKQICIFDSKDGQVTRSWTSNNCFVGDSLIVFADIGQSLMIYENNSMRKFEESVSWLYYPGDNIIGYNGRDGFCVYYRGKNQLLEPYFPRWIRVSKDIIAYSSYKGVLKVFNEMGHFEVESNNVDSCNVGNGFAVYYNNLNHWIALYGMEKIKLLPIKPTFYKINRNMMVFGDQANHFYVFYKGVKTRLENYIPSSYKMDDDMLVYKDLYGKLKGFKNGVKIDISSQIAIDYELQNQCVIYYDRTNAAKKVWYEGVEYRNN